MTENTAADRLAFVREHMPILATMAGRFRDERPFAGLHIGVRIHLEAKTAVLIETLRAGGAAVTALGNLGTTADDIAGLLRSSGVEILGSRDDDADSMGRHIAELAGAGLDLALDNGAEVIAALAERGADLRGATEETTSGAFTLRRRLDGAVPFPVIVINDSPLKAIVENQHGVGQSVVTTIQSTTNTLLTRRTVVVLGYGWCGRGIVQYAARVGARPIVVEPDPIKALTAAMDGHEVRELVDVLPVGDVFITATGEHHVLTVSDLSNMKHGAIVANAGHFDTEIDVAALGDVAERSSGGPSIDRYTFDGGPAVDLLAQGRMVNLAAAGSRGNAIEIMDLGFALQARCLAALATAPTEYPAGDQPVPADINQEVATMMLQTLQSN